ncbi:MAG TPA: hypothetical protein ENI23_17255 [bacterium]|nr:hypothetical protein [bacterium]
MRDKKIKRIDITKTIRSLEDKRINPKALGINVFAKVSRIIIRPYRENPKQVLMDIEIIE